MTKFLLLLLLLFNNCSRFQEKESNVPTLFWQNQEIGYFLDGATLRIKFPKTYSAAFPGEQKKSNFLVHFWNELLLPFNQNLSQYIFSDTRLSLHMKKVLFQIWNSECAKLRDSWVEYQNTNTLMSSNNESYILEIPINSLQFSSLERIFKPFRKTSLQAQKPQDFQTPSLFFLQEAFQNLKTYLLYIQNNSNLFSNSNFNSALKTLSQKNKFTAWPKYMVLNEDQAQVLYLPEIEKNQKKSSQKKTRAKNPSPDQNSGRIALKWTCQASQAKIINERTTLSTFDADLHFFKNPQAASPLFKQNFKGVFLKDMPSECRQHIQKYVNANLIALLAKYEIEKENLHYEF